MTSSRQLRHPGCWPVTTTSRWMVFFVTTFVSIVVRDSSAFGLIQPQRAARSIALRRILFTTSHHSKLLPPPTRRQQPTTTTVPLSVLSVSSSSSSMTTTSRKTRIMTTNDLQQEHEEEKKSILGKIVTTRSLEECGARLRAGNLVAFPTETVYGLGCHALDPNAVNKVFQAKERPLTDPLIVHVSQVQDALSLWEATATTSMDDTSLQSTTTLLEQRVLQTLCQEFWPGPLTLVAKAATNVPPIVMANTGYVACRCPSHPVALSLIQTAQVPIAAPSANKFGHVSPTRYHHVWDDLKYEDVWVLKEEEEDDNDNNSQNNNNNNNHNSNCRIGVESTVAKLSVMATATNGHCNGQQQQQQQDENNNSAAAGGGIILTVTVLRQGAVSVQDMQHCLYQKGGFEPKDVMVVAKTHRATGDDVANVAPGQTIRHYSPKIPSYLLSRQLQERLTKKDDNAHHCHQTILSKSILLDYGQRLLPWKDYALAYVDLTANNNSSEAAQAVFEKLRWAEQVDGGCHILFPNLFDDEKKDDALKLAVKDRLTRAASGVVIDDLDEIQ